MKRREFLKVVSIMAIAVKAAPMVKLLPPEPEPSALTYQAIADVFEKLHYNRESEAGGYLVPEEFVRQLMEVVKLSDEFLGLSSKCPHALLEE